MKKDTAQFGRQNSSNRGAKQQKPKTLYFDFEGDWRVKSSTSADFQIEDSKFMEKDLIVPSTEVSQEMRAFVSQEQL